MKKTLLAIIATTFTLTAQARIINLNVYQNQFSIESSAKNIFIIGARVKEVPSIVDQVANPLYDTTSSEPETKTTVLKTVKVVQLTLSYEHNQ